MIDLESDTQKEALETGAEREHHYFNGEPLKPFSFARQCAAQRLIGDATSPLENAVLMVFLCTLDAAEIEKTRSTQGRDAFRVKMQEWADANKITLRSHSGTEVKRIADEIWDELEASDFSLNPDKDQKSDRPQSPNV